MGCTQSKIENEEAVARCKQRKHFMKQAVSARNAFAAAHSSYATYLKSTGAALCDFGHGDVQNPNFLPSSPSPSAASVIAAVAPPQSFDLRPPPPPPEVGRHHGHVHALKHASSMPEKVMREEAKHVGVIMEEEEEEGEVENENEGSLRMRRRRSSRNGKFENEKKVVEKEEVAQTHHLHHHHDQLQHSQPQQNSALEYFFPSVENVPGTSLKDAEEVEVGGEEEEEEDRNVRKQFDEKTRGGVDDGDERDDEPVRPLPDEEEVELPPPPPAAMTMSVAATGTAVRKMKQAQGSVVEGKRNEKKSVSLMQLLNELDDHFLKASASAHEVSKMLEATRLHYHSNFADNRGHINHSERVMRVITWNRSFRGMPNMDAGKDDFESEEHETHATVLDKLQAWEKKLYDEVKASELMKFEYQRKVAMLNKLKKKGANSEALEKAKAAVSHLHTRYIVDMQALDSTVSEINRLRDQQLYPRHDQLVDGMTNMWGIMHSHHKEQSRIVKSPTSLDISLFPTETSEHHHDRTYQLLMVLQQWHSQFEKLVNKQKEYIKALNSWLKLNLIPIESNLKEKVSSPPRVKIPPIQRLLNAWHDHLEKLPDEPAKTAIANFAAVIETIFHLQEEEMVLKRKCEETRKELARKTRHFEDWYHKYMQKKIPDELDPDRTEGNNEPDEAVIEKQFLVDQVKNRLEQEEEDYAKLCQQVRQKSLGSLKNRLPDLLSAMTEFSLECSKMYNTLRLRSQKQSLDPSSS